MVIVEPGSIATEFGDVMVQPMLERSGQGPYAAMAQAVAEASRAGFESGNPSPPSVIADVISKAVRAKRPKTRYAVGKYAKPLIFMRKWFGDRAFDRVIMSQVKRMKGD